ncbi:Epimerase domain-containing protein [Fusarium keratoplasticum]|uniref:Epimerase domain-containing protein n=1 Tax=Fusarium keratoplasticum TaxID=1328300 RepID=A0ACC0R9A2_9HYPO|nr:Epimerase domain-containing protein [Fusarium keratoplasticum]KAI8675660.1 Epimerase domain-containing protein [Fusarium keratoplasticum]
MPSAIVTGATGILGREIVKELCSRPEEWSTIYAMSRSKKEDFGPRVKHVHLDLTAAAETMSDDFKDVDADYIFFAAYLQQDSEEDSTRVNGDMLNAFCKALEITGRASSIKRFVLVTGAKNYGVHLGRVKIPMQETDPWLPEPPFPPNFYYRQQRILHEFCEKHSIEWNVTYSNEVFGFAKGNFMNFGSAIAIYAAVSKELGDELVFPGSEEFYTNATVFTDAGLHARFSRWAALEPRAANEAFNVVNGDVESWMNLWPRVAKYFGLKVPADQFLRDAPLASERPLQPEPPASVLAKEMGLQDRVPQSYIRQRIDLVKWSQTEQVQNAWKKMADREGLDPSALNKASWAFAGFAWGRDYNVVLNMTKSRKLGWTGYLDSWENLESIFDTLQKEKVIPKM